MNPDLVFTICNTIVLPQWLLMIVAPRWKVTQWLIRQPVIPVALSLVYIAYVASVFGVEGGGFGSLAEVKKLFTVDGAVVAGWVHYLAFDLLIGSWTLVKSQKHGISHFLIIPCLLLTFMAGPVGWLLYFVIRSVVKK
ncbi:MAG: ABA4-like family protein [Bacteroidota bacterium]